jgi:hypothetical protein
MQTAISILTDLFAVLVVAVFVVAAAVDPLTSARHRLEQPTRQRQQPAHGSHA